MTSSKALLQSSAQNAQNADYAGVAELWANEAALAGYNADIVAKLSRHAPAAQRVLEFGAGIGTLALGWTKQTGVQPECLEIDPGMRQVLAERGLACHASLASVGGDLDAIYTSNVLEHIEDDVATLLALKSHLKPGGVLAIYVPAFMLLYSEFDAAIGHYRRYEKTELLDKLRRTGYEVMECAYADSLGFFAWLSVKLRKRQAVGGQGSGALRVYDRYIFPISRLLDALGLRHLFGKNLLVVARKPAGPPVPGRP